MRLPRVHGPKGTALNLQTRLKPADPVPSPVRGFTAGQFARRHGDARTGSGAGRPPSSGGRRPPGPGATAPSVGGAFGRTGGAARAARRRGQGELPIIVLIIRRPP